MPDMLSRNPLLATVAIAGLTALSSPAYCENWVLTNLVTRYTDAAHVDSFAILIDDDSPSNNMLICQGVVDSSRSLHVVDATCRIKPCSGACMSPKQAIAPATITAPQQNIEMAFWSYTRSGWSGAPLAPDSPPTDLTFCAFTWDDPAVICKNARVIP